MLKWIIYAFEWTVFYLCCRENKHHSTAHMILSGKQPGYCLK